MSKFTPGPWAVNDEEVPPIVYSTETQDMVACLSSDDAYADCWHKEEWGKYNAHLIAAAPDMYEALSKALGPADDPLVGWRGTASHPDNFQCEFCGAEHLDHTKLEHAADCFVTKGRAALAKATGND